MEHTNSVISRDKRLTQIVDSIIFSWCNFIIAYTLLCNTAYTVLHTIHTLNTQSDATDLMRRGSYIKNLYTSSGTAQFNSASIFVCVSCWQNGNPWKFWSVVQSFRPTSTIKTRQMCASKKHFKVHSWKIIQFITSKLLYFSFSLNGQFLELFS